MAACLTRQRTPGASHDTWRALPSPCPSNSSPACGLYCAEGPSIFFLGLLAPINGLVSHLHSRVQSLDLFRVEGPDRRYERASNAMGIFLCLSPSLSNPQS